MYGYSKLSLKYERINGGCGGSIGNGASYMSAGGPSFASVASPKTALEDLPPSSLKLKLQFHIMALSLSLSVSFLSLVSVPIVESFSPMLSATIAGVIARAVNINNIDSSRHQPFFIICLFTFFIFFIPLFLS